MLISCSNGQYFKPVFSKIFKNFNIQWTNLSFSGMGNYYISSMLFEYIDTIGTPDYVYLQFTGLSRIDIPLDKNFSVPDYVFQKKTKFRNWVASGGYNGSWNHNHFTKKIFSYMYNIKNIQATYDLSLQNVFKAIELCKSLKIKYNWSFYYDLTNPPNEVTKIDGYIKEFPKYIDKTYHIGAYPLNFSYETNDIPKDKIHYSGLSLHNFLENYKDKFNI